MDAIALFNPKLSSIHGVVKFHQCSVHEKTIVTFSLKGFPKNSTHACHIHKYGITSFTDPCGSTCEHYNPNGTLHGSRNIHGDDRHVGDLTNNLKSDNEGTVKFSYTDNLIQVPDILGRSVVVHSGVDDLGLFRDYDKGSATTGNAGGRIACAVIGLDGGKCS